MAAVVATPACKLGCSRQHTFCAKGDNVRHAWRPGLRGDRSLQHCQDYAQLCAPHRPLMPLLFPCMQLTPGERHQWPSYGVHATRGSIVHCPARAPMYPHSACICK